MQNPPATLPVGTLIRGRYLVQGLLGKSSFGAVYLVRNRRVKPTTFNLFVLKEVMNLNKQERYQIAFEYMLLRRLHHETLPRVYHVVDVNEHDRMYILIDYIEGPNLEMLRLHQPEQRFSLAQTVTLMEPIVNAVSYLHSQHPPLIHQDIKPANIIVPKASRKAMLVDFGLARKYSLPSTTTAIPRSLTGYEAPEQYIGEINARTDIYGLGATFYTLLTGIMPADATCRKAQLESNDSDPLEVADQVVPALPIPVAEAIQRAMALSSNDRFSTVEQFWKALNVDLTEQLSPVSSTRSHSIRVPRQPATKAAVVSAPKQPAASRSSAPLVPKKQPATKAAAASVPVPKQLSIPESPAPRMPKPAKAAVASILKQPFTPRASKLGLLLILLALVIGIGIRSDAEDYYRPGSATPTPVLLHKVAPLPSPRPTVAPPAVPRVARSYNGTIHDIPGNVTTKITLTGIQQQQGNISGFFTGLLKSGSFSGVITVDKHIRFIVTDDSGQTIFSFDGDMQSDGSIGGTYCHSGGQQQCGDYGIWSVTPAS